MYQNAFVGQTWRNSIPELTALPDRYLDIGLGESKKVDKEVKGKNVKERIAVNGIPISQLRDATCHMGSHSVTCYPTQVNACPGLDGTPSLAAS